MFAVMAFVMVFFVAFPAAVMMVIHVNYTSWCGKSDFVDAVFAVWSESVIIAEANCATTVEVIIAIRYGQLS